MEMVQQLVVYENVQVGREASRIRTLFDGSRQISHYARRQRHPASEDISKEVEEMVEMVEVEEMVEKGEEEMKKIRM